MINNRQGGRRRGRGGQRGQNQSSPGNRQDNRQRGNAAQLLEKYKSMARDSQLAGDRVQTEYYLQFADHYFRVLGEGRSRFDEQRRGRDDDGDEDEGDDEMVDAEMAEAVDERPVRRERPRRNDEDDRPRRRPERANDEVEEERSDRQPRRNDEDDRPRPRTERANVESEEERSERPQRRPRSNGTGDTLSLNVLPPAIGRSEDESEDVAEAAPKRRRTRKDVPPDDGDEVVPAA